MNSLKRVFDKLPKWPWTSKKKTSLELDGGSRHLTLAKESLSDLIDDARLPEGIRESLAHDYAAVEAMLDRLQHGHLHIAAFGRVSTGKSSLLNALIGEKKFTVSPLHGETRKSAMEPWSEIDAGGVCLIDTPGLDEAGGEDRESLAKEVANRSDLVIFVLDGDVTESEKQALTTLLEQGRPVIVALNKSDLYTADELQALLGSIREKTQGVVQATDVLTVAAQPKPQTVIDAVARFYSCENANIHRGVHYLSERATAAYEEVREKARAFLGAAESRELVFVRGTTDAINLVAAGYLRPRLREGDEILVSQMEHHSNIVPWQLVSGERGAKIRVIPMSQSGELILDDLDLLLNERTRRPSYPQRSQ